MGTDIEVEGSRASVTHLSMEEFVRKRWGELPEDAKILLRAGDDENLIGLQRVFEKEYMRKRMILLENNCVALARNYLAAMNALRTVVPGKDAAKIFVEQLDKLPEDIGEIPDV